MIISRRTHPLIQKIRSIRDQKNQDAIFLEGPRLLKEALKATFALDLLIATSAAQYNPDFLSALKQAKQVVLVSEDVFHWLSDVEEPQGILATGTLPRAVWETILVRLPAPIMILDGLQVPGNVGAIVRTAEAAGAAGIVTTPGTAHLFSPKALRGSMGSALRVPILEHLTPGAIAKILQDNGCAMYGSFMEVQHPLHPALSYTEVDWRQATALILGQEGAGISSAWDPFLQSRVVIPMQPPVDSLNVAAAAAILLYESRRQRQTPP